MSEHSALEVSVGIDVCKAWLDVYVAPAGIEFRVPNTKKGHREIAKRLAPVRLSITHKSLIALGLSPSRILELVESVVIHCRAPDSM